MSNSVSSLSVQCDFQNSPSTFDLSSQQQQADTALKAILKAIKEIYTQLPDRNTKEG